MWFLLVVKEIKWKSEASDIIKSGHSSANGRRFPEIAPGQGPCPVECFTEA